MLYLCKDSANRVQNAQARLKRYAEMQPILCKDSERRAQRQAEKQRFLCLDMLSHILSYQKIVQVEHNSKNELAYFYIAETHLVLI